MGDQDVFQPLSPDPIPPNIQQRGDHTVPKLGIVGFENPTSVDESSRLIVDRQTQVTQFPQTSFTVHFFWGIKQAQYLLILIRWPGLGELGACRPGA